MDREEMGGKRVSSVRSGPETVKLWGPHVDVEVRMCQFGAKSISVVLHRWPLRRVARICGRRDCERRRDKACDECAVGRMCPWRARPRFISRPSYDHEVTPVSRRSAGSLLMTSRHEDEAVFIS